MSVLNGWIGFRKCGSDNWRVIILKLSKYILIYLVYNFMCIILYICGCFYFDIVLNLKKYIKFKE